MILSDNMRGALYMLCVTASFTAGDTLMKAAMQELPVFQAVFLRGCLATPLLVGLAWSRGALRPVLGPGDGRLIAIRSLAEVGAMVPFFLALATLPIANVSAILQALPLVVTLAGALFLGEPIGPRRIGAILLGFVGVMFIIRPGAADFDASTLLVLISVAAVTVRDLSVRRISRTVPALFVAAAMSGTVTLGAGALSVFETWRPVGTHWPQIAAASVCIVLGYIFIISSMRWGELAFVTPFRYTALIWALLAGWLVFGDWPSLWTLVGAAIVVGTGLYSFWRERRLAARIARATPSRF